MNRARFSAHVSKMAPKSYISDTGLYAVHTDQPSYLYIDTSRVEKIPDVLVRVRKPRDVDGRVPYTYRHPFTAEDNDCLQFAESLTSGIVQYRGKACVFAVGGRKFGFADKNNVALARKYRADEAANPAVAQAYAIVRTNLLQLLKEKDVEYAPYHIAHVLVADGDSRITLEANAGEPDLARPVFGMYNVRFVTKSFHRRYKSIYGDENAATIVLEKA
jgi:hypothetical protein